MYGIGSSLVRVVAIRAPGDPLGPPATASTTAGRVRRPGQGGPAPGGVSRCDETPILTGMLEPLDLRDRAAAPVSLDHAARALLHENTRTASRGGRSFR